jgi:hypothetical protein
MDYEKSVAARYAKRDGYSWSEYAIACNEAHRYPLSEKVRVADGREIERGDMQITDVIHRMQNGWPRRQSARTLEDERLIGESSWLFFKALMALYNAPDGTKVREGAPAGISDDQAS